MKKLSFVEQSRLEMKEFGRKAIDELLIVLDSEIEAPKDKFGQEIEHKFLAVVKSREQVYLSVCEIMKIEGIDRTSDLEYKQKVIKGLTTTWHELTKIICRPINSSLINIDSNLKDEFDGYDEAGTVFTNRTTDDYLSSISKSKEIAHKLSYQILDRIESLENPELLNEQKRNNKNKNNAYAVEGYVRK